MYVELAIYLPVLMVLGGLGAWVASKFLPESHDQRRTNWARTDNRVAKAKRKTDRHGKESEQQPGEWIYPAD